jgi:hypothetical protein
MKPTQQNLKLLCHYNPETGVFRRIRKITWVGNFVSSDSTPTKVTKYGYYQINIFGRPYAVHRLAFLYMTGRFPKHDIDHINGDRTDNRWVNLREVTRRENMMNVGVRSNSTTGVTGVSRRKDTGKYLAYVDVMGKRIRLGNFVTLVEAVEARDKASKYYGFHANHGKRTRWQG